MVRLEMLPAAHGDCLWIEYGRGDDVRRILIDGGPGHTYPALYERVLHLPAGQRRFELFIITHIDADHIEGAIRLLNDADDLGLEFDRIWFNGYQQLMAIPGAEGRLGAPQGEMLSLLISDYVARTGKNVWNAGLPDARAAFDPGASRLPEAMLGGDCRLTLLSPDFDRLHELRQHWEAELRAERIVSGDEMALRTRLLRSKTLKGVGGVLGGEQDDAPVYELPAADDADLQSGARLGGSKGEPGAGSPFGSDPSLANGSSIAVLLEYPAAKPEVRLILTGDAWAQVLEKAVVKLLATPGARLDVDGFKIPHHGSVANLSESLLGRLRCRQYFVSTSGAKFRHPHVRSVDLLLTTHGGRGKPLLNFNYNSKTTAAWTDEEQQKSRGYKAQFPAGLSMQW